MSSPEHSHQQRKKSLGRKKKSGSLLGLKHSRMLKAASPSLARTAGGVSGSQKKKGLMFFFSEEDVLFDS